MAIKKANVKEHLSCTPNCITRYQTYSYVTRNKIKQFLFKTFNTRCTDIYNDVRVSSCDIDIVDIADIQILKQIIILLS